MAYKFKMKFDNGADVPPPSSYTYNEFDLVVNSDTNAQGYTSWDEVRRNVGHLEIEWQNLDRARIIALCNYLRPSMKRNIYFFNPLTGNYETRTFYRGDRSTNLVRFISQQKYWSTIKVQWREV